LDGVILILTTRDGAMDGGDTHSTEVTGQDTTTVTGMVTMTIITMVAVTIHIIMATIMLASMIHMVIPTEEDHHGTDTTPQVNLPGHQLAETAEL